ncbi:ABC transporter substrate-binding protein [Pseudooceanicola sp.]|jgi:peptide/nickel transport system substrate-binding protein|uniref:ABC transporter substrate-binding protein n=1 Tax=Pseudooceanicola sp. TaxID=1914328 RepID=UPI0040590205
MRHTLALVAAAAIAAASPAMADDTLDVVAQFEIQSPEPSTSGYIFTRMGVAETLTNADPEGVLTPGLATEWSVSEDGLTWTFTLREGVQFHDGTPMTPDTVVNALETARGKPGPLAATPITGIQAGDGTVVLTLSEPFAALPAYLAHYSAQILAPAAYAAGGAGVELIGTGPYMVTDLAPPLSLKATVFPDYWGAAPHVPNVSYAAVSRVETRALMAESGEADFVFGLDPASVARLGMTDATVHSVAIPRTLLMKVNASLPALAEPEARRALSLAIDREGIAKAVLRYPVGATQLFPPSVGEWHQESLEPLAYDPEAAKALLTDLGWTPGSDGILTRDGERFALTLTTYPDRPELPLVAAVLEQQFRTIGIELTIDTTNSSEITSRHADGSLELGLIARNFGLIPNPVGTVLSDYAPTGDWGAMGWQNDEIVDLARSVGRGDGSEAERVRIAEILQTELPIIPIAWYRQTLAVAQGVEGTIIDPWERTFGLENLKLAQ